METPKGSRPGLLPGRNDPQPRGEGSASFDRQSQAVANWRERKGMGDPRITVRNGSCGDALLLADVPRVVRALEDLDLICKDTMLALDDAPPVLPRRKLPGKAAAGHHP